jgi:hypothetical protein
MFLNEAQEPPFLEQAVWYSSMHMGFERAGKTEPMWIYSGSEH